MKLIQSSSFVSLFIYICIAAGCGNASDKAAVKTADTIPAQTKAAKLDSKFPRLDRAGDSLYFRLGDKLLHSAVLKHIRITGGDSINPKEEWDEAFLISGCLVILRNVQSAGHFSHIPTIDRVEIITRTGKKKYIEATEKSQILTGARLASVFLGDRFTSPDQTWGLITCVPEGSFSGYLIINEKGDVIEKVFNEDAGYPEEVPNPEFKDGKFVYPVFATKGEIIVSLAIDSAGNYKLSEH